MSYVLKGHSVLTCTFVPLSTSGSTSGEQGRLVWSAPGSLEQLWLLLAAVARWNRALAISSVSRAGSMSLSLWSCRGFRGELSSPSSQLSARRVRTPKKTGAEWELSSLLAPSSDYVNNKIIKEIFQSTFKLFCIYNMTLQTLNLPNSKYILNIKK